MQLKIAKLSEVLLMKIKNKKGFTLLELIIVIGIIGIISAILIPNLSRTFTDTKQDIVDMYNNPKIVCYYDQEVIYEGDSKYMPEDIKDRYILADIKFSNGITYMYFIDKTEPNQK